MKDEAEDRGFELERMRPHKNITRVSFLLATEMFIPIPFVFAPLPKWIGTSYVFFLKFAISISSSGLKFTGKRGNSLTASSPASGKSPRRSRSMRTVTVRQRTGEDNVRFHDRQTWLTLARSARSRWPNICVSISSGS